MKSRGRLFIKQAHCQHSDCSSWSSLGGPVELFVVDDDDDDEDGDDEDDEDDDGGGSSGGDEIIRRIGAV